MTLRIKFRILQNSQAVAGAVGYPDFAERTIMGYAYEYRKDGDVTVQYKTNGSWKRFAFLCQWPGGEQK